MNGVLVAVLILILTNAVVQFALISLNHGSLVANRGRVPEPFVDMIDPGTYAKSVEYTLAKIKLSRVEIIYDGCVLLIALFSGVLPWLYHWTKESIGGSSWAMAGFLFALGSLLSLAGLPMSWYAQFRL